MSASFEGGTSGHALSAGIFFFPQASAPKRASASPAAIGDQRSPSENSRRRAPPNSGPVGRIPLRCCKSPALRRPRRSRQSCRPALRSGRLRRTSGRYVRPRVIPPAPDRTARSFSAGGLRALDRDRRPASSGTIIDFHGVHPKPPPLHDTKRCDAELLIVGRQVRSGSRPAIVAGDLNDFAWSDTTRLFQQISGLLDPRIGRGLYSTYNANWPFLRWPIDQVFFENSFTLNRTGFAGGSNS